MDMRDKSKVPEFIKVTKESRAPTRGRGLKTGLPPGVFCLGNYKIKEELRGLEDLEILKKLVFDSSHTRASGVPAPRIQSGC